MFFKTAKNASEQSTDINARARAAQVSRVRRHLLTAAILLLVFLGGFVPTSISASRARRAQAISETELQQTRLHVQLGMVAFQASRNNFGDAQTSSTEFFEGVRTLAGRTPQPHLRNQLEAALAHRDDITASLSQADATVKEKLSKLYVDFLKAPTAKR